MKNIYKIHWTINALDELSSTIEYLEHNFSLKEIKKLAKEIEKTVVLISKNPNIFQRIDKSIHIRKVNILKFNTMFYKVNSDNVEILSFYSNRQNIDKVKL